MSNKKRDKITWNIKDILSSTRVNAMTLEQEGAYRRALDIFYLNGFLPFDIEELCKVIGKGCSYQTAKVVRSMFVQDSRFPNLLTHDYLKKLDDGKDDAVQEVVSYLLEDKAKKEKFIAYCQTLKNDEYIRMTNPHLRNVGEDVFANIVDDFIVFKCATGQWQQLKTPNDVRRNIVYFIPYSETFKSLKRNEQPYANPKSATSKLENW